MSQPNYSNLENGKTKLNSEAADKLAGYYGISKEVFFADKEFLINHTIAGQNKIEKHTTQDIQSQEESLDPILERLEIFLNILADEKEELAMERKQLSDVFDKLANRFGISL